MGKHQINDLDLYNLNKPCISEWWNLLYDLFHFQKMCYHSIGKCINELVVLLPLFVLFIKYSVCVHTYTYTELMTICLILMLSIHQLQVQYLCVSISEIAFVIFWVTNAKCQTAVNIPAISYKIWKLSMFLSC